MLREGANASYVGPESEDREIGDRCLVLNTESVQSHVRWVTGRRVGQYEAVHNDDLIADRLPARFEDEFTFEAYSNRLVNVACKDVLEKRGERALLRAIEQEGHIGDLRVMASDLVQELRVALRSDPSWAEVHLDLGDQALAFEMYALRHLLTTAMDGAHHGIVQQEEATE